ncbi:MAG: hypothetical protein CMH28_08470 [Micavibrio sp.]|nr:hypothetical protein [Micavibrio sp.]|tara:strand:- start:105 stop:638 length:534 start_codon:yes stop_codon:yes gene_type:complete
MAKKSKFDINSLKRYLGANSSRDLNQFLETVPEHVGRVSLIAAGIAWGAAAALGLYTIMQTQDLTTMRTELQNAEAVKLSVPTIKKTDVATSDLKNYEDTAKEIYKNLSIRVNGNKITVTASTTANYAEFREALGHILAGGKGWQVDLTDLCVGRECGNNKLSATLEVNKITVEKAS